MRAREHAPASPLRAVAHAEFLGRFGPTHRLLDQAGAGNLWPRPPPTMDKPRLRLRLPIGHKAVLTMTRGSSNKTKKRNVFTCCDPVCGHMPLETKPCPGDSMLRLT